MAAFTRITPWIAVSVLAFAAAAALRAAPAAAPTQRNFVWRDLVRIEQFHPFTVPEGRVLVLQSAAYGSRGKVQFVAAPPVVRAVVNGEAKLILSPGHTLAPGFALPAGTRVEADQEAEDTVVYLLGYLADV